MSYGGGTQASFLDGYEPVSHRIERFYKDHPTGRIITHVVAELCTDKSWVVRAEVYRSYEAEALAAASGYAHEVVGSSQVNRTSALENCETSAIGRALANLNYAPKDARPSREEMETVITYTEPQPPNWENIAKMKVLELHEGDKEAAQDAFSNAITYLEGMDIETDPFTKEVGESVVLAATQARASQAQEERKEREA